MVFGDGLINGDIYIHPGWPPLSWQRNLGQNWLWLGLRKRFLRDFCAYTGVFGDGPSNAANCIFPRSTPVAMATKFGTKLATTRLT